ncbi:MAG: sulfatase [Promethearchaeota archaeon]
MSEKMNVLFIISDQHRADHLGCAGNPDVKTPNLDALANDSVRFTSAFCANPMCMPNRASILTGLYPNAHGVRSNGINLSEDRPTIVDTLRNRGYITASVGKIHLQFYAPPYKIKTQSHECIHYWLSNKTANSMREKFPKPYYGFDHVEITLGHGDLITGHYTDWLEERAPQFLDDIRMRFNSFFGAPFYETQLPEEVYNTTYVEERTTKFLERYANGEYGDKPFFMHCSFPDPHHPVCPPGKYKEMYNPEKITLPNSFKYKDQLKNHPFLGPLISNQALRGVILRDSTEEEVRTFLAGTYGMISMFDKSIGNILALLDKLGLTKNTMIIYTSDHGDFCGDHGMILKGPSPFNGILNVPMIWKVPGVTKPTVTDTLMSSIDIPMTILRLLEIKERHFPPKMQGYDMTPVFNDPNHDVRDCCLIEEDEEFHIHKIRLRHLVTKEHKLTIYQGLEDFGDIFNRKSDPDELNNLWYKNKELRLKLVQKLCHENMKAQSRFPRRIAPT